MADVSKRLGDPSYAQVAVGTFVENHPDAARFVSARMGRVGSGEGVVHCVFHAQVMAECLARHRGAEVPRVAFADLDVAAGPDPLASFAARQPALASYLASNVDDDAQRRLAAHVGLALDHAARGR